MLILYCKLLFTLWRHNFVFVLSTLLVILGGGSLISSWANTEGRIFRQLINFVWRPQKCSIWPWIWVKPDFCYSKEIWTSYYNGKKHSFLWTDTRIDSLLGHLEKSCPKNTMNLLATLKTEWFSSAYRNLP